MMSGRAVLKSWFVSTRPERSEVKPRITIVVELEEGPAFVSNIRNAALVDLYEGMRLEVIFESDGDLVLPLFRPANGAS